jgi:hypothetical protein
MKRIGVICVVLMLCLATVGVSYAAWTKNLSISGTVDTGELDVEFLNCSATDNEQPFVPTGPSDVGQTTVECQDTDGDGDYDTMTVLIEAGYMCYTAIVTFDVRNNGSVPVVVDSIDITEPAGQSVEVALVGIAVGDQIDVGESIPSTLTAHVNTDLPGSYEFGVLIEVVNWNEGGSP